MATILCIETATTNCSVTLSVNGSVIALEEDTSAQYSHAEQLHVFIDKVLKRSGITKDQLDAVAISKGPGSYTGLRIGVSAAKGLCYALEIPLISLPTLAVLAAQAKETTYTVPMLDARRMEVYAAVYETIGTEIRNTTAEILDETSFLMYLKQGTTLFIGSGAKKFKEICNHENAFFSDALPSSSEMASMAEEKFNKNEFEDVAYFEPYYLKDFKKN